uniref:DUF4283 domain-containing protein n=1 Tax=Cannabis sativa TaxID=3483 RepID=A0A803PZS0_CANSA
MLMRGLHGPSGHGRHQNPTGFGKKQGHYPTGFGWKNPLVLRNNRLKMIIVPEEDKAKGWSELKECLNGIIKRKTRGSIEQSSLVKVNPKAGMSMTQRSWADVVKQTRGPMLNTQHNTVKTKGTVRKRDSGRIEWKDLYPEINLGFKLKNFYPRKRFVQPIFFEYMRSKALSKEWNLAIILTRNNTHADWCTIFYNLSRELERKLVVSQRFDDRCIIWCKNKLERDELIKMHSMRVPGAQSLVTFLPWSWENKKVNVKVECRGSWIGIQGLPLNLLNMKSFRRIGARCGGLLDVDKDTAEASFLSLLRLQLMGDDFGFIPETISLNHGSDERHDGVERPNQLTCWSQDVEYRKAFGDGVEGSPRQEVGEEKLGDAIGVKKDAFSREKIIESMDEGSGDNGKRHAIKATICKANPDLVILQEVKRALVDRRFIGSIWRSRFKAWILIPTSGRSGGTLLIWDTRTISVLDSLVGDFSISVLIKAEGKDPWWFFRVYGSCSYKLRPVFWDE